jgi:signal transduction histidine kinase
MVVNKTRSVSRRSEEAYRQLLLEVSLFFHPDPEVSYRFVADRLSAFYGGATAAITLHQGAQIMFKYVANAPEWTRGLCGIPTEDAYCSRTLRTNRVTCIQDVRADAEFCGFPTVGLGWTRYLGAPIRDNQGRPIGTLCIIDGRHDDPLTPLDQELIALLAMRVSVELERERLFEERVAEQRRALEERSRQLERTQSVLQAVAHALHAANTTEDESALTHALAHAFAQVRGVCGVAVVRADASDGSPRPCVVCGEGVHAHALRPVSLKRLWRQLSERPSRMPLPAALARAMGGRWGVACAYRDTDHIKGMILTAYDLDEPDNAFRTVYLEPMLDLAAQIIEGYYLRRRLQSMYEELSQMQQQLIQHEKLSAIGTLAAATAHDIRNIVSSLNLLLTLGADDPERLLIDLRRQLDRLKIMAYRLLSYARPRQLVFEEVHLPSLIQRVVDLISSSAQMAKVSLNLNLSPRLPRLQADATQLENMLVNLALNAIKAMERHGGGILTVSASRAPRGVLLCVSDTGPGIPESLLPRLFEPFVSSSESGFGLGLFSVKRTVELHHGTIRVVSRPNHGATFEIYLPIKQPNTGGSDAQPNLADRG